MNGAPTCPIGATVEFRASRPAWIATHTVVGQDLDLDLPGHVGMIAQELLGVLAPLPDALPLEAEPGARLLDGAALGARDRPDRLRG